MQHIKPVCEKQKHDFITHNTVILERYNTYLITCSTRVPPRSDTALLWAVQLLLPHFRVLITIRADAAATNTRRDTNVRGLLSNTFIRGVILYRAEGVTIVYLLCVHPTEAFVSCQNQPGGLKKICTRERFVAVVPQTSREVCRSLRVNPFHDQIWTLAR